MQDNLKIYTDMYCQGTKVLTVDIKENETRIEALNRNGIQWTYEILDDINIFTYKRAITVRIYIVGEVRTGRYVYTENEADKAHYLAVEDALSQLPIFIHEHTEKPQEQPQKVLEETPVAAIPTKEPQTVPLSQEEILNMVLQQQEVVVQPSVPITTAEQFANETRSEVPFEAIQLPESELDKMLSGNAQSPINENKEEPLPFITPPQPQTPMQFTTEQIQRMNNFKQKFGVKNDADFGKYINAWDKKYTSKKDITPANIESFLQYVEKLGEFPG